MRAPEGNVICISTWKNIKKLRERNNIVLTISELDERTKNDLYTEENENSSSTLDYPFHG